MEEYYRRFEASISSAELAKWNATTHMEINNTYTGEDGEGGAQRFQEMCLIVSAEYEWYSGIWNNLNNITLLGTEKYPRTTTAAY